MTERRRTALITGSGRNIGRACAIALARDGFNIVVNGSEDRTACEETAIVVMAKGVSCHVAMGNVGYRDECEDIANQAIGRFGGVDVLINNASEFYPTPVGEIREEDFPFT